MAQKFLNGIDVSSTTVVNGSNLNSGSTVLDVQGSQGQLFSVTNSLTGDLFSVSDISGIPILNVNSSGVVTIDGSLRLDDSNKIQLGDSQDLELYHDGTHSYISDNGTGELRFIANGATRFKIGSDIASLSGTDFAIAAARKLYLDGQSNTYITESSADNIKFFTGGTEVLLLDSSQNATFAGAISTPTGSTFAGAIKITEAGTAQHILIGNQDSSGVDKPAMIQGVNGQLKLGYGDAWTGEGGTMTVGLTLDTSSNATFAGNIVMAANATVDGVDISALPTTFAPTNAEQNVQSDWNATSGDALILNKPTIPTSFNNLNAVDDRDIAPEDLTYADDFRIYFAEKSQIEGGSNTGDYQDLLVLNSYTDTTGGDANALAFDKNTFRILHYQADQADTNWGTAKQIAYTDQIPTTFAPTDAEANVQANWTETTTTSDAFILNKPTIPTDHGDHDGLYLPIGGGILTGDLKINTQIGFQRSGTEYSNYIKSSQYVSEGYNNSGTPPSDRYWLEYGAKGGHHFVLNTDGGAGSAENAFDDFTIWNGVVDGDRLFEVTNAGNTSVTGGAKVFGSIESRKNIVSNSNYNIAQISSTRTTDDYGGLNKTYAKLDVQTPGPNTDGASSAHGLGHLSIKLADNAGNSDLVQKALLRHDGELILGGFYPQTSETELAGLTIRSRYAGSNRNFLRFQTDHSSATTEWTMAKIYAGDGGNFNGKMYFQVATGSNASDAYTSGHDAQLETAMFIDDNKSVTFNGNITASSALAQFSIVNASAYQLNGTYIVDSSRNLVNISKLRFGSSDAVIDTGEVTSATATTVVASVTHGTYNAAFFDYVIKNGENVRAGTVSACHNGASTPLVEFSETSTVDLGDTSDVTLSVVINGTTMDLQATTTSSTWTIKTLIRVI